MATPYTVFVGTTGQGIWRSQDGGESWRKLPREFSEIRSLMWVPA